MSRQATYFDYAAQYYPWAYENPTKARPALAAIYYFALYTWNKNGHPAQFRLSTEMAMSAAGINSWRTYDKALQALLDAGFIKMITKSKNQYTASVVCLCIKGKSTAKALAKAQAKAQQNHEQKQSSVDKTIDYRLKTIESSYLKKNEETAKKNTEQRSWGTGRRASVPYDTAEELAAALEDNQAEHEVMIAQLSHVHRGNTALVSRGLLVYANACIRDGTEQRTIAQHRAGFRNYFERWARDQKTAGPAQPVVVDHKKHQFA